MPVKKEKSGVDFNEIRTKVRNEIIERFGSVAKFLNSDKGKEFGGTKIKVYLYETGPVNFNLISNLCKYFGIGELTREIVVSREFTYYLNNISPNE